jgi:hypothetical protein
MMFARAENFPHTLRQESLEKFHVIRITELMYE